MKQRVIGLVPFGILAQGRGRIVVAPDAVVRTADDARGIDCPNVEEIRDVITLLFVFADFGELAEFGPVFVAANRVSFISFDGPPTSLFEIVMVILKNESGIVIDDLKEIGATRGGAFFDFKILAYESRRKRQNLPAISFQKGLRSIVPGRGFFGRGLTFGCSALRGFA